MVRGTLEPQTGAHVGRATLAFKGAFKSATAALGNSLPPYLTVCDRQEGIGGNEFMTHPSSPPTPESIPLTLIRWINYLAQNYYEPSFFTVDQFRP